MQRRGVADRGEPEETRLALLAQPLERRHHLAEHLSDAERFAAAGSVIALCRWKMSTRSRRSRARLPSSDRHGIGDAAEIGGRQPDLVPTTALAGLSFSRMRPDSFPIRHCRIAPRCRSSSRRRRSPGRWCAPDRADRRAPSGRRPRRSRSPAPRAAFRCGRILAFPSPFLHLYAADAHDSRSCAGRGDRQLTRRAGMRHCLRVIWLRQNGIVFVKVYICGRRSSSWGQRHETSPSPISASCHPAPPCYRPSVVSQRRKPIRRGRYI